jgi:hypothetical protein
VEQQQLWLTESLGLTLLQNYCQLLTVELDQFFRGLKNLLYVLFLFKVSAVLAISYATCFLVDTAQNIDSDLE